MKPFDAALKKMRAICLALPDTKETPTWGQPHFRVGEKIFSGLGEEKGVLTVGAKLEMDHADAMVKRPGFSRAPYVGHKGWVSIDVGTVKDWGEIEALVRESYRLIAPKKTVTRWEATADALASTRPPRKARMRRGAGRKSAALKPARASGQSLRRRAVRRDGV
jgi:predicted DNA-binding protein (MmcQ/YjbR family)